MRRAFLLVMCVLLITPLTPVQNSPAQAQVGWIIGGLTVGYFLDDLEQKGINMMHEAGITGTLATEAATRNALSAIRALRHEVRADLHKAISEIDQRKIEVLRNAHELVSEISSGIDKVARIEDVVTLDIDDAMARIGMGGDYSIRRIDGAAQFHRDSGEYHLKLISTMFDGGDRDYEISISRHIKTDRQYSSVLDGDVPPEQRVTQRRIFEQRVIHYVGRDYIYIGGEAHAASIRIPQEVLDPHFMDDSAGHVMVVVSARLPDRTRKPWEFWKPQEVNVELSADILLLPRYPARYRLTETRAIEEIDYDTKKWIESEVASIPGCGESGCRRRHHVVARLPPGTQPTGTVRECKDSWPSHGDFVEFSHEQELYIFDRITPLRIPIYKTSCQSKPSTSEEVPAHAYSAETVTMQYEQHAHDRLRNVSFMAGYHPLKNTSHAASVPLTPLALDDDDEDLMDADDSLWKILSSISGAVDAQPHYFDQPTYGAKISHGPFSAEMPTTYMARSDVDNLLRYGLTYEGILSPEAVSWTLIIEMYGGEIITVTSSQAGSGQHVRAVYEPVDNYKRVLVTLQPPTGA